MASLGATYVRFLLIFGTLYSISSACETCNDPWKFVFSHDNLGQGVIGDKDDLLYAQKRGARIKYVIAELGTAGYNEELDNALVYDDGADYQLCGESTLHLNKDRWNRFKDEGEWRFVIVCTDGRYEEYQYEVGSHTMYDETFSEVTIRWYVQESTCPTPIFTHDDDGLVVSGNFDTLEEAVLSGYDIKVNIADEFTFPMQNMQIDDALIAGQNVWNFYTPNNVGVEWWFQILSTNGKSDTIFWNVGEHVSEEHDGYYESLKWMIEPCWRHAYTHSHNGVERDGSLADLLSAVERGQRVKVVMSDYSVELDNVRSDWGQVSGQILSRVSKATTSTFDDDTRWLWQMVHTSGTVTSQYYSVGEAIKTSDMLENKKISWFVDTRAWKKVLSTDRNGRVTFGTRAALRRAVDSGASVRIGLQFGRGGRIGRLGGILGRGRGQRGSYTWDGDSRAWFVMKAENVEMGPNGQVSAELLKSVSTNGNRNTREFEIRDDPFWRFMLVSTESKVDFFQWRVGAHINDGHFVRKAKVNWFVNL